MASINSDAQFNKWKMMVYSEIRKTNPGFKFRQMSKVKFGFQLVETMEKYKVSPNLFKGHRFNLPEKDMNRKRMKEINRDIIEVEPSDVKTVKEHVKSRMRAQGVSQISEGVAELD